MSELEGILVMSAVGALTHLVALELGANNLESLWHLRLGRRRTTQVHSRKKPSGVLGYHRD